MKRRGPAALGRNNAVDAVCEAVRAAYPEGSEAVVAVVRSAFGALSEEIALVRAEVAELRRRLAMDSTTSSKPPSTDRSRVGRRPLSLRTSQDRRPGGQPGHAGQTLAWRAPDVVVCDVPTRCVGCGRALDGPGEPLAVLTCGAADALRLVERAQIIDLPPVRVVRTEHERLAVTCAHCGTESVGAFPAGVLGGVQYGPGVRAFAVALHSYHLVPYARTAECLGGLLGVGPSAGSIARWVAAAAHALAPVAAAAGHAVTSAHAAHADETSLHVAGRRCWLHVAATATHTHYHVHARRGLLGIDAGGVWTDFHGVMVHDGWWPYGRYTAAHHQLCLAHLQREARGLVALSRSLGCAERWLTDIDTLLGRVHRLVRRATVAGRAALDARTIRRCTAAYDAILARARRLHPYPRRGIDNTRRGRPKRGPIAAFADRLIKYRADVLRCTHDARIPPDNNQAERDIRMAKLMDKISGGFRTLVGAEQFCVLRSALATGRKHDQSALSLLHELFSTVEPVALRRGC